MWVEMKDLCENMARNDEPILKFSRTEISDVKLGWEVDQAAFNQEVC